MGLTSPVGIPFQYNSPESHIAVLQFELAWCVTDTTLADSSSIRSLDMSVELLGVVSKNQSFLERVPVTFASSSMIWFYEDASCFGVNATSNSLDLAYGDTFSAVRIVLEHQNSSRRNADIPQPKVYFPVELDVQAQVRDIKFSQRSGRLVTC